MAASSALDKFARRYDFQPGRVLARKYEVVSQVLRRPEGELYTLHERATGIERTAKFFYPHADPDGRIAKFCACKLHRLRHCDILTQYLTQETVQVDGQAVTFLVSDAARGESLAGFLARQPGGRLSMFAGLHLLHAIAAGVELVHKANEYTGELTPENLVVRRLGLGFEVKLLDLGLPLGARLDTIRGDVFAMIRIFHEAIGGARLYARQPQAVKAICLGMRRSSVREKFRDAGALRHHLETMAWR